MRKKMLLFFIIIIFSVFLPVFSSNAENEKKELVYINFKAIYTKGIVLKCGDIAGFEDAVSHWETLFQKASAVTQDFSDSAPLVLGSLYTDIVFLNTPGQYIVTVKLDVSPDYADDYYITDANSTFIIPVAIADPAELRLFRLSDSADGVEYGWYSEDSTLPRQIQYLEVPEGLLFYTDDELKAVDWKVCNDDTLATTTLSSLRIRRPLPEGKDYYYRVKVGKHFSNVIRVSNSPEYEFEGNSCDGTRDGDDHEETGNSQLVQPSPSVPTTAPSVETANPGSVQSEGKDLSSDSGHVAKGAGTVADDPKVEKDLPSKDRESVDEIVTPTKTTLSGSRIRLMLSQSGESISFAWDGICLRIPGSYFERLELEDSSLFSVEMTRTGNSFTLSIALDGQELTEFDASSVQFMTDTADEAMSLFLNGQKTDSDVAYKDGYYSFTVTSPGTYRLSAVLKDAPDTRTCDTTALVKICVCALLVISVIFILCLLFRKKGWRKQ